MNRTEIELILSETLDNRKIPFLVLDSRWYDLFPNEGKASSLSSLEDKLNQLMKEQGKLVNEIKDLKRAKRKVMDEVVNEMTSMSEKKRRQNQRLILELKERIDNETQRVMEIPYEIKAANQALLVEGMYILSQGMGKTRDELKEMREEIQELRATLMEKQKCLDEQQEKSNRTYTYVHNLIGPTANLLFEE